MSPTAPSEGSGAALVVENVSKRFGATLALDGVSVSFRPGEVHALMGENGAGKSTLGKCISGLHRPDSGTIRLGDRLLAPGSIDDAFAAGVRIVHQELAQCPNLSVAENLCLHDLPRTRLGTVDRAAMERRAAALVHRLEPGIDVSAPLGSLPPGRRQVCQIAAALDDRSAEGGSAPRVIVFDEPTSSLSIAEAERLMRIVRELAAQGLTCIYVSHRMGEIFACCDRVTVLRDGRFVATSDVAAITEPDLVEQMIGRRVSSPVPRSAQESTARGGPPVLEVRGLGSRRVRDCSLAVNPGEVLGIGGLVGAGRSELLDAIFGVDRSARGEIRIQGRPVPPARPRAMIRAGVGYVPEDRRLQGLFFNLGVRENIVQPFMARLARPGGLRNAGAERRVAAERVADLRVKTAGLEAGPASLSGGNQQKLLIARWVGPDTRVLLLDEPTRGVDVGAKAEIYRLIRAAADRGVGVILVSSEMPELLALSDRIAVMAGGRIVGELSGQRMTQRDILTLATREDAAAA